MQNLDLYGRLGADAEVIDGKKGKFVKFRVASDEWDGGKVTVWYNVTYNVDTDVEKLKKGRLVHVYGPLLVGTYTAKDGSNQISRDIRAKLVDTNIFFGGNGSDASGSTENNVTTGTLKRAEPVPTPSAHADATYNVEDDLPF